MAVWGWNCFIVRKSSVKTRYKGGLAQFQKDFDIREDDGFLISIHNASYTDEWGDGDEMETRLKLGGLREVKDFYSPTLREKDPYDDFEYAVRTPDPDDSWLIDRSLSDLSYRHPKDNTERLPDPREIYFFGPPGVWRATSLSLVYVQNEESEGCSQVSNIIKEQGRLIWRFGADPDLWHEEGRTDDVNIILNYVAFYMMGQDLKKYRETLPFLWSVNPDNCHTLLRPELLLEELYTVFCYANERKHPEARIVWKIITVINYHLINTPDIRDYIAVQFDTVWCKGGLKAQFRPRSVLPSNDKSH